MTSRCHAQLRAKHPSRWQCRAGELGSVRLAPGAGFSCHIDRVVRMISSRSALFGAESAIAVLGHGVLYSRRRGRKKLPTKLQRETMLRSEPRELLLARGLSLGNRLITSKVVIDGCKEAPATSWGTRGSFGQISRALVPTLRCHPHLPDLIKNPPEFRLRNKAHGSIRIQEGQPIFHRVVRFRECVREALTETSR
jgi:hypothetical protein